MKLICHIFLIFPKNYEEMTTSWHGVFQNAVTSIFPRQDYSVFSRSYACPGASEVIRILVDELYQWTRNWQYNNPESSCCFTSSVHIKDIYLFANVSSWHMAPSLIMPNTNHHVYTNGSSHSKRWEDINYCHLGFILQKNKNVLKWLDQNHTWLTKWVCLFHSVNIMAGDDKEPGHLPPSHWPSFKGMVCFQFQQCQHSYFHNKVWHYG